MYRDILTTSKSLYRLAYTLPSIWMMYKLGSLSAFFTDKAVESMGLHGGSYRVRLRTNIDFGIIMNCLLMSEYRKFRESGIDVAAVRYEDLIANPRQALTRILEYCHLPVDLVDEGLRGLEVDSQRNSVLAKSVIGNMPAPPNPDRENLDRLNKMLADHNLPLIGEECYLEGTITSS